MPSIIVLDTLSPDGLALLDAAAQVGITYEVVTGLSGPALREALARHDGAICRSGVKITADSLAGNHRLKAEHWGGPGGQGIRCRRHQKPVRGRATIAVLLKRLSRAARRHATHTHSTRWGGFPQKYHGTG